MLQTIFEETVTRAPDSVALQYEGEKELTYAELDRAANKLAHALLKKGIQPKTFVPVKLPRSAEQVIAMLALLKAGAIYVPISLEQPISRLEQVLDDCTPSYMITTSTEIPTQLADKYSSVNYIALDAETDNIESQPASKPRVTTITDQDVAYVTYSSGTTGKPKGIPVRHAGLEHWRQALMHHITHKVTRQLGNVSIDFDAHIWEYLIAWTFGAALHITSEETRKDTRQLAKFIDGHRISDATLTPAVLRTFTPEHVKQFKDSGLKAVGSTGEACTLDIIKMFYEQEITIFNCYGPTEATFGLSMVACLPQHFYSNTAPIGKPFGDKVKIKIVNDKGVEVADGAEGELIIESPYLTSGYLKKESAKFFEEKTTEGLKRSYATGDKFVKRGEFLYYLGRINHLAHIKIRGQFVEPVGIENYFRERYPDHVSDVCIIVKESLSSDPMIVAYIVCKQPLSIQELRKDCETTLNSASVPSYFCFVKKLPVNSSGKVDRTRLAQQKIDFQRDQDASYKKPRTELEATLVKIWKKILITDEMCNFQVGISDGFMTLGGNSIHAARLVGEVSDFFKISFPLIALGRPDELTVEKLAGIVYLELSKNSGTKSMQLLRDGDHTLPPLFLLPAIAGESSSTYAKLAQELNVDRRIYAINAPVLLDPMVAHPSIPVVARAYLQLIKTVWPKGDVYIAGWSSGAWIAHEIALQSEAQNQPVKYLAMIDEPAPSIEFRLDAAMYAKQLIEIVTYFQSLYKFSVGVDKSKLHYLAKEEQINLVFNQIKLPPGFPRNILNHIKVFLLASLDYLPQNLKHTTVSNYTTSGTRERVKQFAADSSEAASLGWSAYSEDTVSKEMKGHDHFSLLTSPKDLAVNIIEDMDRVSRNTDLPIEDLDAREADLERQLRELRSEKEKKKSSQTKRKAENGDHSSPQKLACDEQNKVSLQTKRKNNEDHHSSSIEHNNFFKRHDTGKSKESNTPPFAPAISRKVPSRLPYKG